MSEYFNSGYHETSILVYRGKLFVIAFSNIINIPIQIRNGCIFIAIYL